MAARIGDEDIHAPCRARIAALEARIAALEEANRLNSQNSHRPPSSDAPHNKPAKQANSKKKEKKKRKRGAQPGHAPHNRPLLPPDMVTKTVPLVPTSCEACGASLRKNPGPHDPDPLLKQLLEVPKVPLDVLEYQLHARVCACCEHLNRAPLPAEVPCGLIGPNLQSLMAILSARYSLSKRDIPELLELLYGPSARIALGTVSNYEGRTAAALEASWDEVQQALASEQRAHFDETSWPEQTKRRYLWVLIGMTLQVALFRIGRRSKDVFETLLPVFEGIGHADRYAVYLALGGCCQLCWSHLGRDFKKLEERGGRSRAIGREALKVKRALFRAWRRFKAGRLDRGGLKASLAPWQERLRYALERGQSCQHSKTENFCKGLLKRFENLWLFLEYEGVEPTNNEAERTVRHAVLLRRKSHGTQSERGSRFIERMLTVLECCRRQGRNAWEFLRQVLEAGQRKLEMPSLLPVHLAELKATGLGG